jgi:hypothetical protein
MNTDLSSPSLGRNLPSVLAPNNWPREPMVALVRHPSNIVCFTETDFETIISKVTNDASEGEKGSFYPGLVNISGTYCFMNSTMQVRPVLFVSADTYSCHPACIIGTRLSIIPTTGHRRYPRQSRGSRYTHTSRRRSARPPSRCDMPSPPLPFPSGYFPNTHDPFPHQA